MIVEPTSFYDSSPSTYSAIYQPVGPVMDYWDNQPPLPFTNTTKFHHSCKHEDRKEKSKNAARDRREKETMEFSALSKLLPLSSTISGRMDKASVIRLTTSYLKLRQFVTNGYPPWDEPCCSPAAVPPGSDNGSIHPSRTRYSKRTINSPVTDEEGGRTLLQVTESFGFVLSNDGRFLYISEMVSEFLGLSLTHVIGKSIFNYVHENDIALLAERTGLEPIDADIDIYPPAAQSRTVAQYFPIDPFSIRMKSSIPKRTPQIKKSAGYKVVHLQLECRYSYPDGGLFGFCGLAVPILSPQSGELQLNSMVFVSRLDKDFTVLFCEAWADDHANLDPESITGSSWYQHCHPADINLVAAFHKDVLLREQAQSDCYRVLTSTGNSVVQTQATCLVDCSSEKQTVKSILAVNYVLFVESSQDALADDGDRSIDYKSITASKIRRAQIAEDVIASTLLKTVSEPTKRKTPSTQPHIEPKMAKIHERCSPGEPEPVVDKYDNVSSSNEQNSSFSDESDNESCSEVSVSSAANHYVSASEASKPGNYIKNLENVVDRLCPVEKQLSSLDDDKMNRSITFDFEKWPTLGVVPYISSSSCDYSLSSPQRCDTKSRPFTEFFWQHVIAASANQQRESVIHYQSSMYPNCYDTFPNSLYYSNELVATQPPPAAVFENGDDIANTGYEEVDGSLYYGGYQ